MMERACSKVDLEYASVHKQLSPAGSSEGSWEFNEFLFLRIVNLIEHWEAVGFKNHASVPASPFTRWMLSLRVQTKWFSRHNISQLKKLSIWQLK